MADNHRDRLFFACWPTETTQQAMYELTQQVTQGVHGRVTRQKNLHVTLAFLGSVESTVRQQMHNQVSLLREKCFTLCLDTLGYWAKPRILWLGTHQVPLALANLVRNLETCLQPCGYQPEFRPYQVHITLMRQAPRIITPLPTIQPLTWQVREFYLMRSQLTQQGAFYETVERYALSE